MRGLKKVSEVLLIVGEIFSFVYMACFLITAVVFFIGGSPVCHGLIVKGIEEGNINSSFGGTPEEVATYVQILFITMGVIFILWAILTLVNALVAMNARKKPSKGAYIANIVLGLLSCVELNLISGIFGLIVGDKVE